MVSEGDPCNKRGLVVTGVCIQYDATTKWGPPVKAGGNQDGSLDQVASNTVFMTLFGK